MISNYLMEAGKTDRRMRIPAHPFRVDALPFTAQPFMLSRVLPGETMASMRFEARIVSDPILNPIIGWKKEFFFFYVRVTDLLLDAAKAMFVDPSNAEIAGHDEAANVQWTYTAKGAIDWEKKCLERVVLHYFRDEGETVATAQTAGGVPIVQIRTGGWLDSLTDKDLMPEGDAIATATDAGDLARLMEAFAMLQSLGMSDMTYEDWLRSNGITIPEKDENKPELLAHFTQWAYPANTINPANGTPSSAISMVFKETLDKSKARKFFKEPGFVIGVSVTRPKVYLGGLAGSLAGFAQRATDWVPNYMRDLPQTSLRRFAGDTGPLGDRTTPTDDYFVDMGDDLIYGDQFQNVAAFDPAVGGVPAQHLLGLPSQTLNWKYPSEAMCKSFFADAVNATKVKMDGICNLGVMSLHRDMSVGNLAER